jgi:hypothetical protein
MLDVGFGIYRILCFPYYVFGISTDPQLRSFTEEMKEGNRSIKNFAG